MEQKSRNKGTSNKARAKLIYEKTTNKNSKEESNQDIVKNVFTTEPVIVKSFRKF